MSYQNVHNFSNFLSSVTLDRLIGERVYIWKMWKIYTSGTSEISILFNIKNIDIV